jgi:PleD family two-component response regulator
MLICSTIPDRTCIEKTHPITFELVLVSCQQRAPDRDRSSNAGTCMARILIIDDDREIRHPLRLALENAGHEVLEAPDGAERVRLWVERGADLVITDVFMPEKDGLEVIWELKALAPLSP